MLTLILQALSTQPEADSPAKDTHCQNIRAERAFLAKLVDPPSPGEKRRLWQRFFDDYHPVVVWSARKHGITVDEDREDLWSELLIKLMRNDCRIIRRFLANPAYPDVSFKAYLRKAAHNLALSIHRRENRQPQGDLESWQESSATPPGGRRQHGALDPAALDYGSRWTNEFITWLLPDKRSTSYRVFAMKAIGDLSNNEISTELDITPANVAQKIHYFKVKLISALLGTRQLTEPESELLGERRTVLLSCLRLSDVSIRWWKRLVEVYDSTEEPLTEKIFPLKEADYEFPFISKVVNKQKQWVIGRFTTYREYVTASLADIKQVKAEISTLLATGRWRVDKVFFSKDDPDG